MLSHLDGAAAHGPACRLRNLDLALTVCERFEWINRRYDGATFWVGAMEAAVLAKRDELIADAYDAPA